MNGTLQTLLTLTDDAKRNLRANKGDQVHSKALRDRLRHIAEAYFAELRPAILQTGIEVSTLGDLDTCLQELARACHKRGMAKKYLQLLDRARKHLIALDGHILSHSVSEACAASSPVDGEIIRTLNELAPGAAASFQQALSDLQDGDRLSWRGPATDMREALRETLDHLAPDADVAALPGFKLDPNTHGPTMRQKVRYVLKSRDVPRSAADPTEDAADMIDSMLGSFVRSVYTRSNVSTHTPTDRKEVVRLLQYVRLVLCELLEVEARG